MAISKFLHRNKEELNILAAIFVTQTSIGFLSHFWVAERLHIPSCSIPGGTSVKDKQDCIFDMSAFLPYV